MKTQVQKWGNSLALRIPKAVASDIGPTNDSEVQLKAINRKLVVTPVAANRFHRR